MRRMAIASVMGVAMWLGSALAAEAQQITPTGPLSVNAGATSTTYTANVYLPTSSAYRVRLWIFMGTQQIHYSETIMPNPYNNNSVFSKVADHTAVTAGSVLTYKVAMKVGTIWIPAGYVTNGDTINWTVTVSGTRPTKTIQKSSTLALQTVDRDRRRE